MRHSVAPTFSAGSERVGELIHAASERVVSAGIQNAASCFHYFTVNVSDTLWLKAEEPEPVAPVTVSV